MITNSVFGLRRSYAKHFQKPNLHWKKVLVTVWWSAVHLTHYSFLNPWKTVHLRSMLCKLTRYIENCNACSQHWSTKGPIMQHDNALQIVTTNQLFQKLEWIGLWSFASSNHIPPVLLSLLTTWSILTTFFRKLPPQPARGKECFPRLCWILEAQFACYRNLFIYC